MSELSMQRFGRYLILDHLVDGGMAQICRARILAENADKIVAIKMIRPQYSKDETFKKMFIDEIKVTFGLSHPNIAQTYDYGVVNEQLYTAMEYVDGKNIKQYIDKLKEKKYIFPLEISLYIVSQICEALSYAHNFTDKLTGKKLNIIHRDISPHNVMITYDGSVKVIDFGIAKANTNSEETKAGTIKGKLSYLAPEYLETSALDHRYDQFAVGLTLWELLCGKKVFNGENELMILKKIQACEIPLPSSVNPSIKKELDQIVMRSVKKDRNQRYENMEQMNRAIVKYLYEHYPDFNATDLKYFSHELFKADIEEDQKKLIKFGTMDISSFINDFKNESTNGPSSNKVNSTKKGQDTENSSAEFPNDLINKKAKIVEFEFKDNEKENENISQMRINLQSKLKEAEKINPNLMNSTDSKKNLSNSFQRPFEYSKADGNGNDHNSEKKKTSSILTSILPISLITIFLFWKFPSLRTFLPFYSSNEAQEETANVRESENTPNETKAKQVEPEVPMGTFTLTNTNIYQKYYLNNNEIAFDGMGIKAPLLRPLVLRVEEEEKMPIFIKINLDKESGTNINLPDAKKTAVGILSSSKDYPRNSTLTLTIEDNEVVLPLPLSDRKIPIGTYNGYVTDGLSNLKKNVTIEIKESSVFKLNP